MRFKNKIISKKTEPYFVAEFNTSHFGDIKIAKKMIEQAKLSGCDCIKLQSWTSETLYSNNFYNQNPIAKKFINKYSLNEKQIKKLSDYCKKIKIGFSSTPYSKEEVDFLVNVCESSFVKIASMDINNYNFIEYIAKKKVPVVISTGMASMKEIETAINIFKDNKSNNICILHCTSLYPTPDNMINLNNITLIKSRFKNLEVGFSDHSLGNEAAISSIALGARLIEKHFTLDKTRIGMDNQIAFEPNEMKELISKCKKTFLLLGEKNRKLSKEEKNQRKKMRRSVVAKRDIKKGNVIKLTDLDLKRPGTGISADKISKIIGRKAKKNITKNYLLKYSDIQ